MVLGEDITVPESESKLVADINANMGEGVENYPVDQMENYILFFPGGAKKSEYEAKIMSSLFKNGEYVRLEAFAESVQEGVNAANKSSALYYKALSVYELSRENIYKMIGVSYIGGTDMKRIEQALTLVNSFISKYPKHKLIKEAKALKVNLRESIAQSHINIASFYSENGHESASKARIDELKKSFSDTDAAKEFFGKKA